MSHDIQPGSRDFVRAECSQRTEPTEVNSLQLLNGAPSSSSLRFDNATSSTGFAELDRLIGQQPGFNENFALQSGMQKIKQDLDRVIEDIHDFADGISHHQSDGHRENRHHGAHHCGGHGHNSEQAGGSADASETPSAETPVETPTTETPVETPTAETPVETPTAGSGAENWPQQQSGGSDAAPESPPAQTSTEQTPPMAQPTDAPPLPTPIPPTGTASGGFEIKDGKLLINGRLLNGVDVTGQYAKQVGPEQLANELVAKFPGLNVVRLSTSPEGGAFTNGNQLPLTQSIDDINATIRALNAKGLGVIIDNHGSDANVDNNVSQNGAEPEWFAQLARDNMNNNMVMFQPENEPTGDDASVVAEQQRAYNAIRATGSNHIVAFNLIGGWSTSPMENFTDVYNKDYNYVIDAHSYAFNRTDPAASLRQQLAPLSALRQADGSPTPVYIGETGNAGDGNHIDANWEPELNAVWSAGTGAIAWLYDGAITGFADGSGADHLTNPDGSLTSYGEFIAARIRNGAT